MRFGILMLSAMCVVGVLVPIAHPNSLSAQQSNKVVAVNELPDAPSVVMQNATVGSSSTSTQQESSSAQASGQLDSSSTTQAQKSKRDTAKDQMQQETHQRVLGIFPSFGTSYRDDAVSLTGGQKIRLAFRTSTDPVAFVEAALVGGLHEYNDDYPGFGWGAAGYGKRVGAAYLDSLDGAMIGNGFLPALLHQDPRYFRRGHGTIAYRTLYALASTVICKHDNTGKWEPNYSNVGGNLAAGALSNLYYPAQHPNDQSNTASTTISNGLIVTAEGGIGSIFQEFWPDISRGLFHRDPTNGQDAKARALDAMEKQAREARKAQKKALKEQQKHKSSVSGVDQKPDADQK